MTFTPEQTAEAERAADFARFLEYVDMGANSISCWEWQAKRDRAGYGYFSAGAKGHRAHRWLYQLVHGPVAATYLIRHKCDNPKCVNPRHLEMGTPADNKRDQIERGRLPDRQGEKHPLASILTADVLAIRQRAACGTTHRVLAEEFGLSRQHIGKIVRRENWRHI